MAFANDGSPTPARNPLRSLFQTPAKNPIYSPYVTPAKRTFDSPLRNSFTPDPAYHSTPPGIKEDLFGRTWQQIVSGLSSLQNDRNQSPEARREKFSNRFSSPDERPQPEGLRLSFPDANPQPEEAHWEPFPSRFSFPDERTQPEEVHRQPSLGRSSHLNKTTRSEEVYRDVLSTHASILNERTQVEVHRGTLKVRSSLLEDIFHWEEDEGTKSPSQRAFPQNMAPTYRNANRRQNRPGVDHGEFEGIPIRHWRRDFVTVAPPPIPDSSTTQNDIWAVELPHGMPKDYHLLPQHSQDLLRAARSGKIYKRPAPVDEEEADPETTIGDKPEKKDEDLKERGFTAKSWKQVARHLEGPDVGYLAKRRKGLVTATSKPLPVPTVTKATVKRTDAAGNEYIQDVVVPLGQAVEGEVISQIQIPDPNAPIGMAAVQATPPRPRSKPKKKAKGPGRGRKKKPIAPTSAPQAPLAEGVATMPTAEGTAILDGIKVETENNTTSTLSEDIEMADGSAANSDDDDGDDGEDGDEGDEDEDSIDPQDSPSKPLQQSSPTPALSFPPIPPVEQTDRPIGGAELPYAHPRLMTARNDTKSGSPLKNVVMPTSTLVSPVEPPANSSTTEFPSIHPLASESAPVKPTEDKMEHLEEEMQREIPDSAPEALPLPPPQPTNVEINAAVEERRAEEEEEEMLMDIHDGTNNAQTGPSHENTAMSAISAPRTPHIEAEPVQLDSDPRVEIENEPTQSAAHPSIEPEPSGATAASPEAEAAPIQQEKIPSPIPAAVRDPTPTAAPQTAQEAPVEFTTQDSVPEDDDDDYPDLLGGLEKSLGARAETPASAPISENITEAKVMQDSNTPAAGDEVTKNESNAIEEKDEKVEPNSQNSEEMML